MKSPFSLSTRFLLGAVLLAPSFILANSQQPAPVPVTNDTPAATAKPMPPETTPVQGSTSGTTAPMTKDQMKAQRKQQKAEEKAASSNAKAAKTNARAKKQSDKAIQDQEKATPGCLPCASPISSFTSG